MYIVCLSWHFYTVWQMYTAYLGLCIQLDGRILFALNLVQIQFKRAAGETAWRTYFI